MVKMTRQATACAAAWGFVRRTAAMRQTFDTFKLGMERAALVAIVLTAGAAAANAVELVIPAYFVAHANGGRWNDLADSAKQVPTTAIMNPDNGPGSAQDANYVAAIAKVRAAGGKVLGYISTRYSKRALSAVVKDINAYVTFYKLDGIFVDEMSNDNVISHIQYYQSVYNYIKGLSPNYQVMANPGTNTQELYVSLPTADRFVVFEDSAKHYARYAPAAWQVNYPKERFVHIVYASAAAQMPSVMQYAIAHGAGGVYVTSETLSNPYKNLPPYWSQETALAVKN